MDALDGVGVATEAIGVIGLVAASYASTNLDNFVVLSGYSAKSGYRPLFIRLTFVLVWGSRPSSRSASDRPGSDPGS